MKFLFRSCCGESLAIALRCVEEGNEVRLCIFDKDYKTVGDGMIDKTKDFPGSVGWADVVVYDGTSFDMPKEAEKVRKVKPTIGGSEFAEKIEHDRPLAVKIIESIGVKVPDHHAFKGAGAFNQARKFISGQAEDQGWVWKPNNKPYEIFTTVCHCREEMLRIFDRLEMQYERLKGEHKQTPDFLLEQVVEGIEVSTEAWFYGKGFVLPNSTLERKWLMNDDLGEQTGCMGNIIWLHPDDNQRLFRKLLFPLETILKGKYLGPLDINAIVSDDGTPYFLEFTPRFGYSAIFAFSRLVDDFSRLLYETANGRAYQGPERKDQFSCGVRTTIPPYPFPIDHMAEGRPVFGWDGEWNPDIHPTEVRFNEDGDVETTGPDGVVFEVTGLGDTIDQAKKKCYELVEQIYVPDIRYRTDIGVQAKKDYAALVDLGCITEPTKPSSEGEDSLWGT